MTGRRPRMLVVAALGLAAGLLAGLRVAPRMEPATRAAAPEPAATASITTADHRRFQARVLGADPVTDIAVVKIEGARLPTLSWGDSSDAAVGEYVVAIGNPFRLSQTVTMGIVSAVGRSNVGIVDYEDFIQTDAAINTGKLRNELARAQVGTQLQVTVLREGRRRALRVRVEEAVPVA